jgi:hypothetical protein
VSGNPKRDRARIEEAIRAAFEAVLPSLIDEVVARLDEAPPSRPRPAREHDLGPLFDAARSKGEKAVRALLERPMDELRTIARALDRHIGDQARRSKDAAKVRDAIVDEVLRRAWRNDVFLSSGHTRGGAADGPHEKEGARAARAAEWDVAIAKYDQLRPDIALALGYKKTKSSGERHGYELVACVKYGGTRPIDNWDIEIELPKRLLDGVQQGATISWTSFRDHTLFQLHGKSTLTRGDEHSFKIAYAVDRELVDKQHGVLEKTAVARVLIDGVPVAQIERPIRELHDL